MADQDEPQGLRCQDGFHAGLACSHVGLSWWLELVVLRSQIHLI